MANYANATVISRNTIVFIAITGNIPVIGQTLPIPVTDVAEILGECYAVPVKDGGIFRGYDFTPNIGQGAPTFDSFIVTGLKDKLNNDTLYVAVTEANYLAGTYTPTTIPVVVPERNADVDGSGNYTYYWGVPYDTGTYTAYVSKAGVMIAPNSTGTTLALLVTDLNTNAATVGTWSNDGGKLKLVTTSADAVGVTLGNA